MPHSPYLKTVYPPIRNVDEYRQDLARHRAWLEDGEVDIERNEMLLDIGESLVEHCDFLETKLNIKKHEYGQLAKQNDTMERENETLKQENEASKEESQAQKLEIAALKSELEKREGAKGTEEQLGSNSDGTWAEANSQDLNSEVKEADNLEESKNGGMIWRGSIGKKEKLHIYYV